MTVRHIQLQVVEFTCDVCGRTWLNKQRIVLIPTRCPSCRSREWNGKKHPSHKREITLPSPRPPGRPRTFVPDDETSE